MTDFRRQIVHPLSLTVGTFACQARGNRLLILPAIRERYVKDIRSRIEPPAHPDTGALTRIDINARRLMRAAGGAARDFARDRPDNESAFSSVPCKPKCIAATANAAARAGCLLGWV